MLILLLRKETLTTVNNIKYYKKCRIQVCVNTAILGTLYLRIDEELYYGKYGEL